MRSRPAARSHNAYDFDVLLKTTITFPIAWDKSKLDSVMGSMSIISLRGFPAYWTFGHTRARYFQSTGSARYQHKNAEWVALAWRYDSGLTVTGVLDVGDAVALTPAQQTFIDFSCNGVGKSKLLTFPQTGQEDYHHNPDRVKPRHIFQCRNRHAFPSAQNDCGASRAHLLMDPIMIKFTLSTRSGDRKAMLLATLCFIHCVAGPVLLSFAGYSSLIAASEKMEPLLVLSSVILGSAVLIPAYRKKHRRCSCLALFVCGLLCLIVFRRLDWMMIPDAILTGLGVALIIGAHALNMKFSRQCECCEPKTFREADRAPNSGLD